MRLGVGGGAFGVRGGVSTRGLGVGVGPFSAGTSWRGRRSRRSGGGGGVGLFVIALIISPFLGLCSHHSANPSAIENGTPGQYQPVKTAAAAPPASSCLSPLPDLQPTGGGSEQPTSLTVPDLAGLNAQVAEDQLKRLGLRDVMSSANPEYKMVLVAKNWQVVSQEPAAGCAVHQSDEVDLDVTKP